MKNKDTEFEVVVYEGRKKKVHWKGNDEEEAYEQFLDARVKNLKKNDVVLYKNKEETSVYDSQEDYNQDEGE